MKRSEFFEQLRALLGSPVEGLSEDQRVELLEVFLEHLKGGNSDLPELLLKPFVWGRRPFDEVRSAGYGSSEHVGLVLSGDERNRFIVLYLLRNAATATDLQLHGSLWVCDEQGEFPLPGFESFPIPKQSLRQTPDGIELAPAEAEETLAFSLTPEALFRAQPEAFPAFFQERSTDDVGFFSFGHQFFQKLELRMQLLRGELPLSEQTLAFELYHFRQMGSLYKRIVDKLLLPDTVAQCRARNHAPTSVAYHPWYPVLLIGSDKAALYMQALYQDIVEKSNHLTDPRWLLRVGLYLELLTCIGVFEAVKDQVGDLLTPAERERYESCPSFAQLRERVDVEAWAKVWQMRTIAFPKKGVPNAGPVSLLNLLNKKKVTLAFLETHHEDLKHAIELSGPNLVNGQETWHRVFRDAERAVLRKCPYAFPELAGLSSSQSDFVLWHRQGTLQGVQLGAVTSLFGDQDGLYPSACNQYRASMNEVAHWAKERGWMDYTGDECVAQSVSILEAHMSQNQGLLRALQARDGYPPKLEVDSRPQQQNLPLTPEQAEQCLGSVSLLALLRSDELQQLAAKARTIHLGPTERIVIQGREGSSLFIAYQGALEVILRQSDGKDVHIAVLEPPAVFGEMSFLTGAPRTSTVRAIEHAILLELHADHLRPIVQARPQLLEGLSDLMQARTLSLEHHKAHHSAKNSKSITRKLRSFLLAGFSKP